MDANKKNKENSLAPELLAMLVCPLTGGRLDYNSKNNLLISPEAGKAFPVRGGIPVLLAEEAIDIGAGVGAGVGAGEK